MSRRRYDNRARTAAAQAARRRTLEAAAALFAEQGYAGTTIADIARAAGVSPQSVYAGFGGKAALLKGAYDVRLAGDDADVALAERPELARMAAAGTAAELLHEYAALARVINARLRPLLDLIWGARAVEPELDALALTAAQERRVGTGRFATHAVGAGLLREDLDATTVADLAWVLIGPETYLLLVRSGGLDDDGYQAWLETALRTALT